MIINRETLRILPESTIRKLIQIRYKWMLNNALGDANRQLIKEEHDMLRSELAYRHKKKLKEEKA